jgi:hypothetical protein
MAWKFLLTEKFDFLVAFDEFADDKSLFGNKTLYFISGVFTHNGYHTNTHVEDAVHFVGSDISLLLDQIPEGWERP